MARSAGVVRNGDSTNQIGSLYELEVYTRVHGFYKQLALKDRRGDTVGIWLSAVGLGLGVWEGVFE